MAMLRNLKNMITRGISDSHHKKILSRLTNEVTYFRFFFFFFNLILWGEVTNGFL